MSAAETLARMIRHRIPAWVETSPEPGLWRFTDPDEDYAGRYVEVDGGSREQLVVAEMSDRDVGPTLAGYAHGICVHVTLPDVSDSTDMRAALAAAQAIYAMPKEPLSATQEA